MAVARPRKNLWMQRARESMERRGTVGDFTRYCKRKGYGGVTEACIREALAAGGRPAKMARFARAARRIARRRRG